MRVNISSLIVLICISFMISGCSQPKKLYISDFKELKNELLNEYDEIDNVKIVYDKVPSVFIIIELDSEISEERKIDVFSKCRIFLIKNYGDICSKINAENYLVRLGIDFSFLDNSGFDQYTSEMYSSKNSIDYFKTWSLLKAVKNQDGEYDYSGKDYYFEDEGLDSFDKELAKLISLKANK